MGSFCASLRSRLVLKMMGSCVDCCRKSLSWSAFSFLASESGSSPCGSSMTLMLSPCWSIMSMALRVA